ncbi:CD3324 family protein [Evansella sp. AB-rgal1]|uniref:CD3324 family protein n=1 Tax=Evansella sp. AB-rgal1 TaxID=3242696 RepID=UPI00359D8E94
MEYKNGKEVLPHHLLKELQNYIQGELIYVPKKENQRAGWGENTGSRQIIKQRNEEIYRFYLQGSSFEELEKRYCLSMDSIRKIIYKARGKQKET